MRVAKRIGLIVGLLIGSRVVAQESSAAGPAGGMAVLGNDSYLHAYMVYRTPEQVTKDGQITVCLDPLSKTPKPLPAYQSPPPSADWTKAAFDDSGWERRRAPVELVPAVPGLGRVSVVHSATVGSLICLRGRFKVEDTAKVQDLKVSVEYVGGLVIHVNGHELARGNMPKGAITPETPAENYPDDLYGEPGGLYLQDIRKDPTGFARRYRVMRDVAIPASLLQKGVNVLALEIHRAPINEGALAAKRVPIPGGMAYIPGYWAYAGLKQFSLTVANGSAVEPNIARPKGVQVWNCAPFDTINSFDYGDGGEPLPIGIAASRNGVFSGRLVVSSDQAITGLKVAVSDLTMAGAGTIAASSVRVRYAAPAVAGQSWVPAYRFDGLLDAIPPEVPVGRAAPPKEHYLKALYEGQPIERKGQTNGALASLWFTVRVPAETKPGLYAGTVRVSANGLNEAVVPLRVAVSAWRIPDPKDFTVHNFAYHSEDAMALHYGVPMWSERHFELMGKSLAIMAEINAREATANLCINFCGGDKGAVDSSNVQSLIRWIKQSDGTYQYDFTLFDKYLDTVAKAIGKPNPLRLNCWNPVEKVGGKLVAGTPGGLGKVFAVTLLDPATGNLSALDQPVPGTPESLAFWKPVLDAVRKKAEARGWFDVTAMGWSSYCYSPQPEVVSVYKNIWPDGIWAYTAHNGTLGQVFKGVEAGSSMPVRYADTVWGLGKLEPRGYKALLKPRTNFWCYTWRTLMRDYSPLSLLRSIPEDEIMRGQDGVSDFGADLFPLKSESGRYYCIGNGRGTGGPGCSTQALLAPGTDGPIATERFEMLREGVELAEALLFVEKALEDHKVTGELATKANRILDERGEASLKDWPDGRMERDAQLIALAGEIAASQP